MCGSVQLPLMRQGCKTNAAIQILDLLQPNMQPNAPKSVHKEKTQKTAFKKSGHGNEQAGNEHQIPDKIKKIQARDPLSRMEPIGCSHQNPPPYGLAPELNLI